MQSNMITLAIDDNNDGGITPTVELIYTRFNEYMNRSEYISEEHSLTSRDLLSFYRSLPKVSGNFRGTAKTAVKFTKDYVVPGVDASTSLVRPGLIEVSFSLPIGLTPEQTLALRMRAVALLLNDTVMIPLTDQQMI